MRIDILTLFPGMFAPLQESIVKRAVDKGLAEINIKNIRDYTEDKHHTTDERLYGGGAGMVLKPEPIFAAVEAIKKDSSQKPRILLTSPQGRPFKQAMAQELSQEDHLIFICGHYEGVDERIIQGLGAEMVSVGDFVLTGGELPAMVMVDALIRLLPGALGHENATAEESFNTGLLEYPQYTRPPVFQDLEVPKVLQSGNHQDILLWRREKALERTWQYRRELLEEAALTEQDMLYLEKLAEKEQKPFNFFVALLHHPVYNKKKQIITTSLTNLDLHDIARASATFGVEKYHLVQPVENQRKLIGNLLEHWQGGFGAVYNPHRKEALSHVVLTSSIEETISMIEDEYGSLQLIATSAQPKEPLTSYKKMRAVMEEKGGNYLLLLGTGWGLTEELMAKADYRLRPIYGRNAYNHLSVRSAASIMLDRLLGEKNSH